MACPCPRSSLPCFPYLGPQSRPVERQYLQFPPWKSKHQIDRCYQLPDRTILIFCHLRSFYLFFSFSNLHAIFTFSASPPAGMGKSRSLASANKQAKPLPSRPSISSQSTETTQTTDSTRPQDWGETMEDFFVFSTITSWIQNSIVDPRTHLTRSCDCTSCLSAYSVSTARLAIQAFIDRANEYWADKQVRTAELDERMELMQIRETESADPAARKRAEAEVLAQKQRQVRELQRPGKRPYRDAIETASSVTEVALEAAFAALASDSSGPRTSRAKVMSTGSDGGVRFSSLPIFVDSGDNRMTRSETVVTTRSRVSTRDPVSSMIAECLPPASHGLDEPDAPSEYSLFPPSPPASDVDVDEAELSECKPAPLNPGRNRSREEPGKEKRVKTRVPTCYPRTRTPGPAATAPPPMKISLHTNTKWLTILARTLSVMDEAWTTSLSALAGSVGVVVEDGRSSGDDSGYDSDDDDHRLRAKARSQTQDWLGEKVCFHRWKKVHAAREMIRIALREYQREFGYPGPSS